MYIYIYIYSNVVCLFGFSSHQQVANNQFNWWDPANDFKSSCGDLPCCIYIYIYMYCYCDCFGNWITIGRPLSCSADSRTRRLARACGICQHAGSSARVSGMQVVVEIIWDMWGYEAFHQILTGLYSRSLHISDWLMCIMFALAAYTYPYVNITSTGLLLGSNEKNECVVWLCCMIFLGV